MPSQKYLPAADIISKLFYCTGMIGIAAQHFVYADSRPVLLPPLPAWMHTSSLIAYALAAAIITACFFILFEKKNITAHLLLGGFLLLVFLLVQSSYILFIQPNSPKHLGLWTDALKELALAGGAFVMAGLINTAGFYNSSFVSMLKKLIPAGRIFFSITMFLFGLDHFYYTDFVKTLVPSWIPGDVFWTYFAGIALMASAIAITFKILVRPAALLLSIMLFIWFLILHIPRAIADPYAGNGNEITSVFEALAFSGIALGIYVIYSKRLALMVD